MARLLAHTSFCVLDNVSHPPHSLLDELLCCDKAPPLRALFAVCVVVRYLHFVPGDALTTSVHCQRLRRFAGHMHARPVTSTSQLAVMQWTAPHALRQESGTEAHEWQHVNIDQSTDALVAQVSFVAQFFPEAMEAGTAGRDARDPGRAAHIAMELDDEELSLKNFCAIGLILTRHSRELQKKSRYWFFRTHHQLVPLVHCVARCVSANAVALCLADPAHTRLMSRHPDVLGAALAHGKAYIAKQVPRALELLVPTTCEGRGRCLYV